MTDDERMYELQLSHGDNHYRVHLFVDNKFHDDTRHDVIDHVIRALSTFHKGKDVAFKQTSQVTHLLQQAVRDMPPGRRTFYLEELTDIQRGKLI